MLRDLVVEYSRDSADRGFVADVRRIETTRSHAAKMFVEFSNHRGFAHALSLDCSRDTRTGSAIDADIGLDDFCCGAPMAGQSCQEEQETESLESQRFTHGLEKPLRSL